MAGFGALRGPLLFAHRGARLREPENSLPAFGEALRAGADALEIDVHMTRDRQIVVAHDATGTRVAGEHRAIADCTLLELKRWDLGRGFAARTTPEPVRVPTLAEALEAFPGALFNVDVKDHAGEVVTPLLEVIARLRAEARVLLTSFSSAVLARLRAAGYPGPTGLGQSEAFAAVFAPRPLLAWKPLRGARLQIPLRYGPLALGSHALIERVHHLGIAVDYWVVNDAPVASDLIERGADGIVTDDPHAMAEVFARSPRTTAWRERHAAGGANR